MQDMSVKFSLTLPKKYPYSEFCRSVFSTFRLNTNVYEGLLLRKKLKFSSE